MLKNVSMKPIAPFPLYLETLEDRAVPAAMPYFGVPLAISPNDLTIIEAENFDHGGQGVAYFDLDARTDSVPYRAAELVDLSNAGGTTSVTSVLPGEWLAYTTNVSLHGEYDIVARVSSSAATGGVGGYFHLEMGQPGHPADDQTALFVVPGTSGVGNWTTVTISGVHLHEGDNWLKLVADSGNFAIDRLEIRPIAHAHIGDTSAATEHHQLENLVALGDVTHTAIRNGNWSSPSTWAFGAIPSTNANVWIPQGTQVTYDVASLIPIRTIRVDGTFSYATNANTMLLVDTIAVLKTGRYEQGTVANPIASNVSSVVVFSNWAPIDRAWDPTELSRGLISHGAVSIHGTEKTAYSELAVAPAAGATTLVLSSAPTNWKVGDSIVIPGVTARHLASPAPPDADGSASPQIVTQDEDRTITAISGTTIWLDSPLTYSHVPPTSVTDVSGRPLKAYVANLYRNVSYHSANLDASSNDAIHRNGHVMFMHSDKVSVNFAAFENLGRTNKARLIDDVKIEPTYSMTYPYTQGTGTNVRGRYALHFHRTGVNGEATPAIARGVAVVGGPGWGFVNHSSYVIFEDDIAFGVAGSGFVEELGDGIGAVRRSMAIGITGTGRSPNFNDDPVLADLGFAGHGFFFRGNAVDVEDNIAFSAAHSGFAWINRADFRQPLNQLNIPANALHDPDLAAGGATMDWESVPTRIFRRNMAVATSIGVASSFWTAFNTPQNDGRNEIRDFTGWNLFGNTGMLTHYTRDLTMINVKLVRDSGLGSGYAGIQADVKATGEHIYDNVKVYGYAVGLRTLPESSMPQRFVVLSNSDFATGNTQAYSNTTNHVTVNKSTLANGVLTFTGVAESVRPESSLAVGLYVSGTKIDSLGTQTINGRGDTYAKFFLHASKLKDLIAKGYFTDPSNGSKYLMIPVLITDRVLLTTKVFHIRAAFDPTQYPTLPVGPNLGSFVAGTGNPVRQINAGGPKSGSFLADTGFSGGAVVTTSAVIDKSAYAAGPYATYQSARVGESTYTMTGLSANSVYTVRLHFAEIVKNKIGERQFDVRINGRTELTNFDIRAAAGAKNKVVIREFLATADASGRIVVEFVNGAMSAPSVSALEVLTGQARMAVNNPGFGPSPGSYTDSRLVTLATTTPGALIYYTTNGSTPTTSSTLYTKPLVISATTTIKARAYAPGLSASEIVTGVFTINPESTPYRLNMGGPAVGGFAADTYTKGYINSVTHTRPINTSAPNTGPASLYQSYITLKSDFNFWTILPNLDPSKTYTVRLHFAEPQFTQPGDRQFDVWINRTKVLANFDVYTQAGGKDRAIAVDFAVRPDLAGQIFIDFKGQSFAANAIPFVNAIEVLDPSAP